MAPLGFYTPGWEHKLQSVKPRACFDVCDEQRNWFRATIMDRFVAVGPDAGVDCDGHPVEECTVGLRWYDETGLKRDKKLNLNYHGFGETLDLRRTVSMASI